MEYDEQSLVGSPPPTLYNLTVCVLYAVLLSGLPQHNPCAATPHSPPPPKPPRPLLFTHAKFTLIFFFIRNNFKNCLKFQCTDTWQMDAITRLLFSFLYHEPTGAGANEINSFGWSYCWRNNENSRMLLVKWWRIMMIWFGFMCGPWLLSGLRSGWRRCSIRTKQRRRRFVCVCVSVKRRSDGGVHSFVAAKFWQHCFSHWILKFLKS